MQATQEIRKQSAFVLCCKISNNGNNNLLCSCTIDSFNHDNTVHSAIHTITEVLGSLNELQDVVITLTIKKSTRKVNLFDSFVKMGSNFQPQVWLFHVQMY